MTSIFHDIILRRREAKLNGLRRICPIEKDSPLNKQQILSIYTAKLHKSWNDGKEENPII